MYRVTCIIALILLSGCFALVGDDDTMQNFGISSDDVNYIIKEGEKTPDSQKSEFLLFEKRNVE